MPHRFGQQAEYYFRLAELADAPEDKARLISIAYSWHRLAQELALRQLKPSQGMVKSGAGSFHDAS